MKPTKFALIVAPLLFAVGCATTGSTPEYLPSHISFTDSDLSGDLTPMPVIEKFDPTGGLSTVEVPLRCNTDFAISVEYKFTFLDASGVPIDANPAWQNMLLEPGVVTTLTGTSPMTTAKDFHVDIKPAVVGQ